MEAAAYHSGAGVYRVFYHKGEEKEDSDHCLYCIRVFISYHGRDQ
jgi:hypothetical protein